MSVFGVVFVFLQRTGDGYQELAGGRYRTYSRHKKPCN